MGKGKKKKARGKGKKRDDKKTNDSANACGVECEILDPPPQQKEYQGPTQEQYERAREAAANRTEDPLKNWVRTNQEECPICMLPFPPRDAVKHWHCCGKTICGGCAIGAREVQRKSGGGPVEVAEKLMICPFCRSNNMDYRTDESKSKQEMKRANAGNGEAIGRVGECYFKGMRSFRQDKAEGLKWYHRAVEAGDGRAAYNVGAYYLNGDGVEKDWDKALEYFQKAADFGFIPSFAVIGKLLFDKGDIEEGILNYRKAAMCGMSDDGLFNMLRNCFRRGYITKDEYACTLRENQAAVDETKSEERELYREQFPRS